MIENDTKFGFEELEVWQKAVEFADFIIELLENFIRRENILD